MLLHPDGRPVAPGVGGTFWMVLAGHARLTAAQGQFRVQAGEWIALTATQANEVLAGLGLKPEFHRYLGMNHTISEAEVQDLKAWLEKSLK